MKRTESPRPWKRLVRELSFFLLLAAYYEVGNFLFEVDDDPTPAYENAANLWELEKKVGIAWEKPAQALFQPYPLAMWAFVFFYSGPHFVLTYGFLVWAFLKRPHAFPYVRNAAIIVTTSAFTFEWLFPVAPPRLMPETFGMRDTVHELLPVNNGTPWITAMVNDYAGFPSIHTSWSLLIAILAIRLTSSPWRWLWLLYPSLIALSITATANHVTWDIVGAVAWVGGCELLHQMAVDRWNLPRAARTPGARGPPVPHPVDEGA